MSRGLGFRLGPRHRVGGVGLEFRVYLQLPEPTFL